MIRNIPTGDPTLKNYVALLYWIIGFKDANGEVHNLNVRQIGKIFKLKG